MSSRRPSASSNASVANQQTSASASSLAVAASSSAIVSAAPASSAVGSSAPIENASNHSLAKELSELSFSIFKTANTLEPSGSVVQQEASASVQSSSSSAASAVASAINSGASGRVSSVCGAKCIEPAFLSDMETLVLRSERPISVNETEQITVLGNQGIWANKSEVINWKGELPIEEYKINEDPNPELITKIYEKNIEYVQELAVRYLRPPRAPTPGEIIIKQEPNTLAPPAPPLVIRQQPPRPCTPEPLVVRERPPKLPEPVGKKIITISGQRLPPPPRKVIVERLASLPNKPQAVITERWLPYTQSKRKVIYQAAPPVPSYCKPKNVVVQWQTPNVVIKQEVKFLGVVNADPNEYLQRYASTVVDANELPEISKNIPVQGGHVLAADYQFGEYELEGDIEALKLVGDLEAEGLAAYKSFILNNPSSPSLSSVVFSTDSASPAAPASASIAPASASIAPASASIAPASASIAPASASIAPTSASIAPASASFSLVSVPTGSSTFASVPASTIASSSNIVSSSQATAAASTSSVPIASSASAVSVPASASASASSLFSAKNSSHSASVVLGSGSVITHTTVSQLLASSSTALESFSTVTLAVSSETPAPTADLCGSCTVSNTNLADSKALAQGTSSNPKLVTELVPVKANVVNTISELSFAYLKCSESDPECTTPKPAHGTAFIRATYHK